MRPPGRPKAEYRSAQRVGTPMSRTCDCACAQANACECALALKTCVLQA